MLTEKQCSTCKLVKQSDKFYKTHKVKSGLSSQCKLCHSIWAKNNKEKVKAAKDKYRSKPDAKYKKQKWTDENRQKLNKRSNQLRTEKRWAGRERKPTITRKESIKKYYELNKDKFSHQRAIRRALTRQATPSWANENKILKIYALSKRLNAISPRKFHVDHIVPLRGKTVCGLHNEFNLMIVSANDNLKKSNKTWPDM